MYSTHVKISIIIPSYNQGEYIADSLESIINQQYPNAEIIVIDGGSTDNTIDVIKKYESHITYWQSQKDNGQSAAINEGFKRATGDFVTWLNSDDVFFRDTLHIIDKEVQKNPQINWFLGNVLWMNKKGEIIKVGKVEKENWKWNRHYLFSNGGPSAFMRRSYLNQMGLLREDFHYMMDTELWYRFIKNGNPFIRISQYCWGLRLHEAAKMSGHNFSNSPLANNNHPSWIQKRKESDILKNEYPINILYMKLWRLFKLFSLSFYTRFSDKQLLGKKFSSIIVK